MVGKGRVWTYQLFFRILTAKNMHEDARGIILFCIVKKSTPCSDPPFCEAKVC